MPHDTRTMTITEHDEHKATVLAIRSALSILRLCRTQDENLRVAAARLEEWLTENDGRWVK